MRGLNGSSIRQSLRFHPLNYGTLRYSQQNVWKHVQLHGHYHSLLHQYMWCKGTFQTQRISKNTKFQEQSHLSKNQLNLMQLVFPSSYSLGHLKMTSKKDKKGQREYSIRCISCKNVFPWAKSPTSSDSTFTFKILLVLRRDADQSKFRGHFLLVKPQWKVEKLPGGS